MVTIGRDVERYLTLLRNLIRSQGYTQLEVQEALGWGRSYISQLLTKQKSLRVEQVLAILNVIGIDPAEFFGELYGWEPRAPQAPPTPHNDLVQLRRQVHDLVNLLSEKGLISLEDLSEIVREIDE